MSTNQDNHTPKQDVGSPPAEPTAPPVPDVENQTPGTTYGVSDIIRRWKREDFINRGSLGLRGLDLLFSLLAFIIMASNKHGDWKDFDKYEEYRYVLAIAILSTLYAVGQALRQVHELWTGNRLLQQRTSSLLDFFGDQIMAYLLISAASSAVPMTNRMRERTDNIFTDASAAAISMTFLAFLALALSAMISGYKLSAQPYI
ncbi:CASP-like protein 4B1 [Corylus avellana]|uniref:CASP-like protein 4B1 n=1 Tax=Corylus avellana TaxID=13451 RepID=UPI001E221CFC|nr:CASP-like protein 4B1 [Corylus avellana]